MPLFMIMFFFKWVGLILASFVPIGEPPSARELVDKYSGVGLQFRVKVREIKKKKA